MHQICRALAVMLAALSLVAVLCSCGAEKDPLIGDWESSSELTVLPGGGDNSSQPVVRSKLSLRPDGTGDWVIEPEQGYAPVSMSFEYSAKNGVLTIVKETGEELSFAYSFSDGLLMLESDWVKQQFSPMA